MRADGVDGDLRRRFVGEAEFARGNAAERDAAQSLRVRKVKAGAVARGQRFPVFGRDPAVHHRSDRVQHIAAGQIERGGQLRPACRFLAALPLHDLRAIQAQLHAGEGVDGVPYTYHNHTLRQAVKISTKVVINI